jgi:hypothetical protein
LCCWKRQKRSAVREQAGRVGLNAPADEPWRVRLDRTGTDAVRANSLDTRARIHDNQASAMPVLLSAEQFHK